MRAKGRGVSRERPPYLLLQSACSSGGSPAHPGVTYVISAKGPGVRFLAGGLRGRRGLKKGNLALRLFGLTA